MWVTSGETTIISMSLSPGQKRAVVIDLPSQDHEMLQGK